MIMLGSYEKKREIKIRTAIAVDRSAVPTMNAILRHGGSVICFKREKLSDNKAITCSVTVKTAWLYMPKQACLTQKDSCLDTILRSQCLSHTCCMLFKQKSEQVLVA